MKGFKEVRFLLVLVCTLLPFLLHSNEIEWQEISFPDKGTQYLKEAEELQKNGEFAEAIEIINKSLALIKTNSAKEKECDHLIKLGLLYWNLGQMSTSTEKYQAALKIAKKNGLKKQDLESQSALDIYSHYVEAKELRDKDQFDEATQEFQTAIDMARQIGSKEHELKCLRQLGLTYWFMNEFEQSYSNNEKGLEIAKELNHKIEIGRCSNNIGLYYWRYKTDYSQALRYYQEALQIAKELENKTDEADFLSNMGIIYKRIGNLDKAIDLFNEALQIDYQLGREKEISKTLNNLGTTLRSKIQLEFSKNDFNQAIEYYKESLELARKIGDKETEIKVLNNLGSINSDAQNYSKALEYFNQGLEKAKQSEDRESEGMLLNNLGIVHYNLGNYEKSTQYFESAIHLVQDVGGGQILWEAYLELGNTLREQNEPKKALQKYKNSIETIELIRSNIQNEEQKASFLGTDKRIEAYQNLIDLLVLLHESEPNRNYNLQAYNYMEQAKARAFLDSLELSKIDISSHVDFKLLNQEKELEKDITKVYTQLLDGGLSPEGKDELEDRRNSLEDQLEAFKLEIRTENPAYAQLIFPKAVPMQEVQKKLLDNKTAFFAYTVGKRSSYAFVLTKKELKIFEIPPSEELQNMVSNYLKIITDKSNQDFDLGYTLFSQLVMPGINANIKNIIFVPGDILNFLPFETLITQKEMNRWLIEDYTITYAPSISSLYELIDRKKTNGSKRRMELLALGDPYFGSLETEENGEDILKGFFSTNTFSLYRLEYSGIEIEKIGALFSENKKTIFQRESASEEQLKNQHLEDYKILHFATHSLIDDKKPDRSSIILALDKDQKEDGLLRMDEIYNLNLNSDLVTLSACQTGLGQLIRGEGIEGINRAFFYAGASSVLMSLWAVNDQATYQLMERFYTHLRSSDSIMKALRKAKLEMINSGTLSHPYYWAGFIISGKANQTIFPNSTHKLLIIGFVCFLMIGIIIVGIRRNKKSA
ncbi:MAG: CHAT domain-containing protein [Candidatus Aminicenantaceae bacterium]